MSKPDTATARRTMGDKSETLADVALTPAQVIDEAIANPEKLLQINSPVYGTVINMRASLLAQLKDATEQEWQESYVTLTIHALKTPNIKGALKPIGKTSLQTNVAFVYVMGQIIRQHSYMPELWTNIVQEMQDLAQSPQQQEARGLQPETAQTISNRFTTLFELQTN